MTEENSSPLIARGTNPAEHFQEVTQDFESIVEMAISSIASLALARGRLYGLRRSLEETEASPPPRLIPRINSAICTINNALQAMITGRR